MIATDNLDSLEPEQLREVVRTLVAEGDAKRRELAFKQAIIDKLTHENAVLKRLKFAAGSEAYSAEQKSLIEETLDADFAAVAAEIEALEPGKKPPGGELAASGRKRKGPREVALRQRLVRQVI